ncbi:condensation domain-containing protein [Chitinophaga japonensis]|uniref:Phthiocerol/phthiodiolone dimycocerosyl transferase n=1 Tax=Chitinophaga japonensis TaxID=104662 RepID=A0A562T6Z9_CHIJA|nr:condensation domain-containing protein [Chitinophaga japonensis]TWI89321.1 NRPS condensation-like uncharacterized protein [Chitinophaga japonensis]
MKRKLLFLERFIYADGTIPKNITFTVKIRGVVNEAALRNALAKVQAKHPLLTVGVKQDSRGTPWFVSPSPVPEVPLRIVERSSEEDWMRESEKECAQPFDMQQGPLLRMVWIRSGVVSDLVLVCHHCICDGASIVTLFREILLLLDQPGLAIGQYESFSSIADLVPDAILSDKKLQRKGRVIAALLRLFLFFVPGKKQIRWGKDYTLRWKLDKAATAALVRRCKEERTTVHAALCTAFLWAFRQVKGAKAKNQVFCPVNLRRYITEIKDDMLFGFATSITLSLDKAPGLDFSAQTRKVNDRLSEKLENLKVYEELMLNEYYHPVVKKLSQYMSTARGNNDLTFSNMGRLDIPRHYHSFEVETIHNPVLIFKSANPNGIIASTFDDQLNFSFLSNDAYLAYEEAEAIKNKAMELLMEEKKATTVTAEVGSMK